jgi:hypothetical protein
MRLLFAALLLAAAGCSPGPALSPVTGRVVYADGAPLNSGVVEFAPEDGGPVARGMIRPDGTFRLGTRNRDGAMPGRHKVAVVQTVVVDGSAAAARHKHKGRRLHDRYRRFDTSGIERTVEPGNSHDFRIEVEAARE